MTPQEIAAVDAVFASGNVDVAIQYIDTQEELNAFREQVAHDLRTGVIDANGTPRKLTHERLKNDIQHFLEGMDDEDERKFTDFFLDDEH